MAVQKPKPSLVTRRLSEPNTVRQVCRDRGARDACSFTNFLI